MNTLVQYLHLLPAEYHDTLLRKELRFIEKEALRAAKRSEYARVAARIRKFAALPGAAPLANELVMNLRDTYTRRLAYLQELSSL